MGKKVIEEYYLGIDMGTGSTKAVALNKEGMPFHEVQFFYDTKNSTEGYSEQDPEDIWDAFIKCVRETVRKLNRVPNAVSLSSAMHSLIIVDKNNTAITPLITWADSRSEKIAEELRESDQAKKIYEDTGTPIHSMTPLCKITWFKKNEPATFKKAAKFISIKELIWFRLFNVYEIDTSIASATGLFNIKDFDWNKTSLKICGIDAEKLSTIVPTVHSRKNINSATAKLMHIPGDTMIYIGANDGCLANIGSYAIETGIAALTIGTSGAVRIACSKPVENFDAMIFNYVLDKETFICGGPINNGGSVIKWMFKTFLNNSAPTKEDYNKFFKMVDSISPGSEGLIFLPYLYGERAPVWDENAAGAFFGVKPHHTLGHFLRASVEGICYALNSILQIIENSTSPIKQLNVSGGFINSSTWIKILADITGKKICLSRKEDASSIGAALLAMKTEKVIESYPTGDEDANIIHPHKKWQGMYKEYFEVYKTLYEPTKNSMHELSKINRSL